MHSGAIFPRREERAGVLTCELTRSRWCVEIRSAWRAELRALLGCRRVDALSDLPLRLDDFFDLSFLLLKEQLRSRKLARQDLDLTLEGFAFPFFRLQITGGNLIRLFSCDGQLLLCLFLQPPDNLIALLELLAQRSDSLAVVLNTTHHARHRSPVLAFALRTCEFLLQDGVLGLDLKQRGLLLVSLVARLVPLLTQLFLQLEVVRLDLLQASRCEHLTVLADLPVDEVEQFAHLEGHIEELLVDQLGRVVLTESLEDALQVPLQIPELVLGPRADR